MKNLILAVVLILIIGCKKEDVEVIKQAPPQAIVPPPADTVHQPINPDTVFVTYEFTTQHAPQCRRYTVVSGSSVAQILDTVYATYSKVSFMSYKNSLHAANCWVTGDNVTINILINGGIKYTQTWISLNQLECFY